MIYTIFNEFIEVQISDMGAELMSIKSKSDGTEYLWQGNPEFWGGRAYNMFPICGRLTEGKYTYMGGTYEMNLHGFVRKSALDATLLADDKIDFGIRANENTLKQYPFDFEYHILYTLVKNTIKMSISVTNHGEKTLIFSLGGHPGFNVPLGDSGEQFTDYYLEFTPECQPKSVQMSPTCFITGEIENFPLVDGRILPLRHSLFDNDAIILQEASCSISLRSYSGDRSVTVDIPPQMKYVGIWHAPKKAAPYVAIEPWTSLPAYDGVVDDMLTKRDMFELAPFAVYELDWSITVD